MSRLRGPGARPHEMVAAVLLVALLGVMAGDTQSSAPTAGGGPDASGRITGGASALGELLAPTRSSAATAGWLDAGSAKSRPSPHPAIVSVGVALHLVLLVAGATRRRPGRPWHHLRRHSAVLRAPPFLLTP